MRRIVLGLLAFVLTTATLLVLPVYAAPMPAPHPVHPRLNSVPLGSIAAPAGSAVVLKDGQVTQAGPQALLGPGARVGATDSTSSASSAPVASPDALATSGTEIAGVPALTVSQPTTASFSSVGVTWRHDPTMSGVTVRLRTKRVSGDWGPWTVIDQNDVELRSRSGESKPTQRSGTDSFWTGKSIGIQAVVQAAGQAVPSDVRLELVDPQASDVDIDLAKRAPAGSAHAAMTQPPIYSRAQWGADESLMTWTPEYAPTIKAAIVNHTADGNDYTAADVPAMIRAIYAYHAVSLGWGDIGYNFVADKFGGLWEGRSGGMASTVVGGHAMGFNEETFGISMLGNYDIAPTTPAMVDAISSVIAWKFSLYGINPSGTTNLVSGGGTGNPYPAGTVVSRPTIIGHRDVNQTVCPGQYGYAQMDTIRSQAAQKLANPALQATSAMVFTRNTNTSGVADQTTYRGNYGDIPLACDWFGLGKKTLGVFRAGQWFLFNSNDTTAPVAARFWFGDSGDLPVCGDWDGNGTQTAGVFRNGVFYLRNANSSGVADGAFPFGAAGDTPLVGKWNGGRFDTIGVWRQGTFYLAYSNIGPAADVIVNFGADTDLPVTGDWTGTARTSVGVYRLDHFYLTNSLATLTTDATVYFGGLGDRPITGDWTGAHQDTIGVYRGY